MCTLYCFQPHWCVSYLKELCCLVIFRRKKGPEHFQPVIPVLLPGQSFLSNYGGSIHGCLWERSVTAQSSLTGTAAASPGGCPQRRGGRWMNFAGLPALMAQWDPETRPNSCFQTRMSAFGPEPPCLFQWWQGMVGKGSEGINKELNLSLFSEGH